MTGVGAGPVRLRDVTLRETAGAALGVEERLAVLAALATVPVAVAEAAAPGGAPDGGPDAAEFFRRARDLDLGPTELSVACRITPCDRPSATDAALAAVRSAGTRRVTLVLDGRVAPAAHPGCGPGETITAIAEAVGALRADGHVVLVDVGYAVESFAADPVCLVDLVAAGLQAGAEAVVLDDTAGLALPQDLVAVCESVVAAVGPGVGVACGDASGCAIANSLLAAEAGARWLQTSARPGTADLATTVADLVRAGAVDVDPRPDLAVLAACAARLDDLLGPGASARAGLTRIPRALEASMSSARHVLPSPVGAP